MGPRPSHTLAPGHDGGFVLPVALFVLVLLSMISATGIYVARADFRAAAATRQAAVALAAADAGASRTIALWSQLVPVLPAPGATVVLDWQTLPDGSLYRSEVTRAPVAAGDPAPQRVLVRTIGMVAPPGRARRTVMTVVEATGAGGPFCCAASVKVVTRLTIDGPRRDDGIPDVDGTDRIPAGWPASRCTAPLQDIPGVVTSDAGAIQQRRTAEILGAPPVVEDPSITPLDFDTFGGLTYAELTALADVSFVGNQRFRNEIGPVTSGGTCVTGAVTNWGSPLAPTGPCGNYAPIIHVAGNLSIRGTGQGQGILLVDGDLQIASSFDFFGVVIVQGRLRLDGPGRLIGAVMVRGGPRGTGRSTISNGGRVFYSSCAVEQAQAGLPAAATSGSAAARERSWFEVIG